MSEKRTIENEEEFREYLRELGASEEKIEEGLKDVRVFLQEKAPEGEELYPFEVDENPMEM